MELTYQELQWLISRGGRNIDDVLIDEKGKYVEMVGKRHDYTNMCILTKVRLPKR